DSTRKASRSLPGFPVANDGLLPVQHRLVAAAELLAVGGLVVEVGMCRPTTPAHPALRHALRRDLEVGPVRLAARELVAVYQGLVPVHVRVRVSVHEL